MRIKFPVKIRRLKILGTALALSALAALLGVTFYLLPPETIVTPISRINDFVVINDGLFVARKIPNLAKTLRLPDLDPPNDRIRLVMIDEASLKDAKDGGIGQFPWPRQVFGEFLRKVGKAGAKVVVFDVEFYEKTRDPKEDASFIDGLRHQPTILGMSLATTTGGILSIEQPPPEIERATARLGSTTVDTPGGWLVGQAAIVNATFSDGKTVSYPSLAINTAAYYLGADVHQYDKWHASIGNEQLPLDGQGKLLVLPFIVTETIDQAEHNGLASRAGAASLTLPAIDAVSFVDFMNPKSFDADTTKAFVGGNIVVVGSTAQAQGDYISTPNGRFPGVFSNVRLMDQVLNHRFIRRVPPWLDITLIVLMPLLIGFLVTQLPATRGVVIAVLIALGYGIFAIALYAYTLHWINLIHVSAAIILSALFVALFRTITEGADKRVIREMFGKHVSPALVDQMMSHDDPLKALDLSGKRVKVTIFYTDIRGFTAMSENMTPEQIYGQLNEYFEEMCKIVFERGGYVDKFIGDCLMAVFSAPDPRPNDALEGVECALAQQEKIDEMMVQWAAEGRQIFTVGMGLNTGEVVMGNLGSSDRLNYTVIGDNVNTAARLYNVAKGGQIIISESTYNEVKDRFLVNELNPVFVKGKVLPLRNFEILGRLKPGEPNTSTLLDPDNLPVPTAATDH